MLPPSHTNARSASCPLLFAATVRNGPHNDSPLTAPGNTDQSRRVAIEKTACPSWLLERPSRPQDNEANLLQDHIPLAAPVPVCIRCSGLSMRVREFPSTSSARTQAPARRPSTMIKAAVTHAEIRADRRRPAALQEHDAVFAHLSTLAQNCGVAAP